jgi:hypothetical protein
VAIREFELKSGHGTADYLLCNSIDQPLRSSFIPCLLSLFIVVFSNR